MLIQKTFDVTNHYSVLHIGQLILAVVGNPANVLIREGDCEELEEWQKSAAPNRKNMLAMQWAGLSGLTYWVSSIERAIAELSHLLGMPLEVSKRLPAKQPISVTAELKEHGDSRIGETYSLTVFTWGPVFLGSVDENGKWLGVSEALPNCQGKNVSSVVEAKREIEAMVDEAIGREYQP